MGLFAAPALLKFTPTVALAANVYVPPWIHTVSPAAARDCASSTRPQGAAAEQVVPLPVGATWYSAARAGTATKIEPRAEAKRRLRTMGNGRSARANPVTRKRKSARNAQNAGSSTDHRH